MDTDQIFASALAALPEIGANDPLPADIQVFPPGKGVKFTLQDYPGQEFEMDVDAGVAAKANADLQALLGRAAAGQGPQPFADRNHEDAEATFHPLRYFWGGEDPKAGGVRVVPDWNAFGASLVRAKAFKYFSQNFLFSKGKKKFLGLINENVGGLVNRPGFATQQAFAKAAAPSTNQNESETMTAEEFKKIVDDAIKPINAKIDALEARAAAATTTTAATQARAAADTTMATAITEAVTAAMKPVTAQLEGFKKTQEDTVKAQAKATVARFVGRVGLAPQDADAIAFWEAQVVANPDAAVKMLEKLPARAAAARYTSATPGATTTATAVSQEPEDVFMAKAKAYAKDNKIDNEADAIIAFAQTGEGKDLYEQFQEKVRSKAVK